MSETLFTPEQLAEFERRLPEVLRKVEEDLKRWREEMAVDRDLLDLPVTI